MFKSGAPYRTRTCEPRRDLIYSQAILPLTKRRIGKLLFQRSVVLSQKSSEYFLKIYDVCSGIQSK